MGRRGRRRAAVPEPRLRAAVALGGDLGRARRGLGDPRRGRQVRVLHAFNGQALALEGRAAEAETRMHRAPHCAHVVADCAAPGGADVRADGAHRRAGGLRGASKGSSSRSRKLRSSSAGLGAAASFACSSAPTSARPTVLSTVCSRLVLTNAGRTDDEPGWPSTLHDLFTRRWRSRLRRVPERQDALRKVTVALLQSNSLSVADLAASLRIRRSEAAATMAAVEASGRAVQSDEDGLPV